MSSATIVFLRFGVRCTRSFRIFLALEVEEDHDGVVRHYPHPQVRRILCLKLVRRERLRLAPETSDDGPPSADPYADAYGPPSPKPNAPAPITPAALEVLVGCAKHRATARLAVARSAVLLRNGHHAPARTLHHVTRHGPTT